MFRPFLDWLDKRGRKRIMPDGETDDNKAYLIRYPLIFKEKLRTLEDNKRFIPFNIYLHNFKRSDPQDMHDHPWWWMTVVLKGGYWEHTPRGRKWRGPGSVAIKSPQQLHRVEASSLETWTLFFRGPKIRTWGYKTNHGWVNYKEYCQNESVLRDMYKR